MRSTRSLEDFLDSPESYTGLNLNGQNINADRANAIARALEHHNSTLTKLHLGHNKISTAGANAIARALKHHNSTLTTLDLQDNQIGPDGAKAIARALEHHNSTLKTLNLQDNQIGPDGANAIARALEHHNSTLTTLNLRNNQIDAVGADYIGEALMQNDTLTTLNLSGTTMGADGATSIASALEENSTLATLFCSYNQIGVDGATSIASALEQNHALETLDLGGNQIKDTGATSIAGALGENNTLATLYLHDNQIKDTGATSIARALEQDNSTLTTLYLKDNQIGAELMSQINALMNGVGRPQTPQDDTATSESDTEQHDSNADADDDSIPAPASESTPPQAEDLEEDDASSTNDIGVGDRDSIYNPLAQEDTDQEDEDSTHFDGQEQKQHEETRTPSVNSGAAAADHRLNDVVDELKQKINELMLEKSATQLRLKELKEQQAEDHEALSEMDTVKKKLVKLDVTIEEVKVDVDTVNRCTALFERLIGEVNTLARVAEDKKQQDAREAAVDEIMSAPYKKAFYERLRIELNSAYLAASAIDSGWIKNDKKGELGYFGSFVKEASAIVPFVGGGVKILGVVLQMADSKQQQKMITNYATIVVDVRQMNALAEEVARKIVSSTLEFDCKPETMITKLQSIFNQIAQAFASSAASEMPDDARDLPTVAGILNAAPDVPWMAAEEAARYARDAAMEGASDRMAGIKEAPELVKLGEEHAREIAKIIIAGIFSGEIKKASTVQEAETLADSISTMVINKFTVTDGALEQEDNTDQARDTTTLLSEEGTTTNNAKYCCIVSYATGIIYDNKLLNHPELLEIVHAKYGSEMLPRLIELGSDIGVAEEIITNAQKQGVERVLDIIFGNCTEDRLEPDMSNLLLGNDAFDS